MNKKKLYEKIDNDEELSDAEKRDAYFSELEEQEDYERWKDDEG